MVKIYFALSWFICFVVSTIILIHVSKKANKEKAHDDVAYLTIEDIAASLLFSIMLGPGIIMLLIFASVCEKMNSVVVWTQKNDH